MLKAVFYRQNGRYCGFDVSGHAGYGTEGNDVVCAAVSSAVELVCNTITDFFKVKADVTVGENKISLRLIESSENAQQLIESFYQHMLFVAEDYSKVKVETQTTGGKNDD